jgi:cytochrome c peroxidase
MKRLSSITACCATVFVAYACATKPQAPAWEQANPIVAVPQPPLGLDQTFGDLPAPDRPTPERVRLGRWLFYDTRLSADNSISCATCHRPENGFSEQTPHSTGIRGQQGTRKAPSFENQAWTLYPNFFWDGRAGSLEEQALGPVANPIEMGNTHTTMIQTLNGIAGYRPYFKEAFGTEEITKDRVAKAIADYERTCMSGDSPWDRWKKNHDETAVSDEVKLGDALFFGKAGCNQCHLGQSLTDSTFHNIGVGYNAETGTFADEGRSAITKKPQDRGAFKTPGLRDVALRAPYMHDGSLPTLRAVVEHYNQGGIGNPTLDPKIEKLNLTDAEVNALVKFMEALNGQMPRPTAPTAFPQ